MKAGFFAVLITGKKIPPYVFVTGEEENRREVPDPYAFGPLITPKRRKSFRLAFITMPMRSWVRIR